MNIYQQLTSAQVVSNNDLARGAMFPVRWDGEWQQAETEQETEAFMGPGKGPLSGHTLYLDGEGLMIISEDGVQQEVERTPGTGQVLFKAQINEETVVAVVRIPKNSEANNGLKYISVFRDSPATNARSFRR